MADDILRSHVAAMLSAVFPEGEDFFVRSVRNYRDQITDPVLKEQVKGFIGQEALHGREHRAFNERLHELGYPTRFTDKRVKIGLGIFSKVAPKRTQLAFTAGLEHYTATLAEALLRDDAGPRRVRAPTRSARCSAGTPSRRPSTSRWPSTCSSTCAETSRCGSARCTASTSASCSAWCRRSSMSLAFDRYARRHPIKTLRSLSDLRTHVFFQRNVQRRLRDYHRADFHPDDHDTVELLDHWRHQLDGLPAA